MRNYKFLACRRAFGWIKFFALEGHAKSMIGEITATYSGMDDESFAESRGVPAT
jgi:hypothetical protein